MSKKDEILNLKTKAEELSHRITGGDGELMRAMDNWYDAIRKLEHYGEHKSLVAISGKDFPIIVDYINEECLMLIPESIYKEASDNMR